MTKAPRIDLSNFTGVMKAAQKADGNIDVAMIDVEKQVRSQFGDLDQFAEGIKANGLDNPIIVLAKPDGRYRLIAGERRVRAFRLLEWAQIPARIRRDLTPIEIRGIQVRENNDRENLSIYDEAMGVAEDVANYGFKEAVAIWNRSDSWVSKRKGAVEFHANVLEVMRSGMCSDLEVLHSLNQLIAVSEVEFEAMVLRMGAGVTVSRDDVRNKVSSAKTWKKQTDELAKTRANPGLALASVGDSNEEADQDNGGAPAEAAQAREDASPGTATTETKKKPAKSKSKPADKKGTQGELSGLDKSGDRQLADDREKANQKLQFARSEIMDWGQGNRGMFNSMQENMGVLGFNLAQGEWVLWTAFKDMVLPMMESLGADRSQAFMKKLQGELKSGHTPMDLWRDLHQATEGEDPADDNAKRVVVVSMPNGWTF